MLRRFVAVLCSLALAGLMATPVAAAQPKLTFQTHLTSDGVKLRGTLASGFTLRTAGIPATMHTLAVTGTKAHPHLAQAPEVLQMNPAGGYPFYLTATTADLAAYYAAKDWWGAPELRYQMGKEIAGFQPFFFLYNDGTGYSLVDSFTWFTSAYTRIAPLRIDDDYPTGTYTFTGTLVGSNGAELRLSFTLTVTRPADRDRGHHHDRGHHPDR